MASITMTFREMLDKSNNWDDFCTDVGLNPWLLNEGLAEGSEEYTLDLEIAKKHGLV